MFIGSINRYMRAVLGSAAGEWAGRPVWVACPGNFTVERILARCGVGEIHSNDVSIYSCALGWAMTGDDPSTGLRAGSKVYRVREKASEFAWLGE